MIFLFWDVTNDTPEILGEDGEFYFYSEDSVAIEQDPETGRMWTKSNKMQDITPLNNYDKFEFWSELANDWIPWGSATMAEVKLVHKCAHDPDWDECL